MFQVELTNYGQTLISSQVIFDGIILLYDYIEEISSLSDISSYTVNLDEEACGNLNKNVGNVRIRDLSISEYQSKTILFYVNDNNEKKFVAGYSQTTPIIQKNGQPLILFLSFDFSAFTHGFLFSSIQAGMPNASHNNDGIVHIENPDIVSDDTYSVYSKPQVDDLLSKSDTELVKGTQTASVAAWTGVSKRSALFEGMQINYFLPYAGKTNSTLNLTLANNTTTGAIPIYFRGATAVGTHFPVGSLIQLTYMENVTIGSTTIAAGWFADSDYVDGNTTSYTSTANPLKAGTNGIYGRCLVMRTGVDTWESIMLSYTNKPANHVLNTSGFYTDTIFYTSGTTTVTSGNSTTATHYPYYNTLSYTNYFLDVTTTPLVIGKPVYLVGNIGNDGKFYLKTTGSYQAQEVTTSDIYLYLGLAFSTTAIGLMPIHPMFTLKNGVVVEVTTQSLKNSDRIDSIQNSIPTNTSDLTNDSGFITSADIPTDVSDFNNDAGYITTETDPTVPSWAKQSNKPSYTLDEVTDGSTRKLSNYVPTTRKVNNKALSADITLNLDDVSDGTSRKIPTKVSDLTNDSGFISTETDPTVPSWAKQPTKPTYTASEVGALPDSTVIPTVNDATLTIKKNASDTGDTFTANASQNKTINLGLATVAISGSYNDLSNQPTIPSDTSDLTNGAGFITSAALPTNVSDLTNDAGYITTETDPTVPSWAKQSSKPSYTLDEVTDGSTRKLSNYVPTTRKVNNKALSADITLNLDDVADGTSRKIPTKVSDLTNDSGFISTETDPTVPSWSKQPTKPTYTASEVGALPDSTVIPTVNDSTITIKKNASDTGDSFTTNAASGKTINLGLATVATSGSYNDLSNKPTIPTVNNAKLTIKKNASDAGTEFTANASTDVTCNLGLATVATSGSYNDLSNKPSIPANTSDLTNDSDFITAADIPEDVSAFNNDAGYLTSYTETDPTVPSWAKQQNKPSYTLDEVSDGSSRKLSNYVPTSRKVNNKALSADITLNLDDVADGTNRKLGNYIPYSEVLSTINGFDNRRLWLYEVHNTLWAADKRYDVTRTGFSSGSNVSLFNGSFEDQNKVAAGGTGIILIAGKNGTKMFGGGYPYGYLEIGFYYTSVPESVTCRVYSDWAQNPGWHDVTLTNVDKNNNNALYRGQNSSFYGVTQIEITINAKSDKEASVTEIAFYQTRGTLQQMATFNKSVAQTLYFDLEAPKFKTTGGTASQFVKGDGTLDGSAYITSASLPTKVSDLTNDAGYITSASIPTTVSSFTNDAGYITSSALSPYALTANLKEGAFVDVDELTMTSTSDNLPTSKAVASYISSQSFATISQIPTNVSQLNNDAGYLTQHQSLAGVVATAQYNSTTKKIEFYNSSNTKLNTDIDASDFIKDGMVDTVSVTGGNLVITFNTDAGKEDITIPITDIFDASNYYTKTEIDNAGFVVTSDLDDYVEKVSSTDNAITRFDGANGAVQNSGVLIDDSNNLLLPLGSSSTFSQNAKLVIGNAWFGSNTTGGLAYGVKSGSTYTGYYTFESTAFRPVSSSDNAIDIGTSSYRWKDLYIAGKICKNGTYKITIPSATGTMALVSDIPTKTSDLTNDSGFITISSVPTKTSDLTNDSGFITSASLPTKTSDLTNDSGFITSASLPTKVSDLTNDSGFITSADIPTGVAYFNNDAGYLTSSDLSPYALTASLSEGAFVDVDETTTTASSTNLVTGKSMAAYVSSQLPTVNNATLTIQKNGTTVNTFTANASSPVTANITVPTTVAELTDSSDYVTNNDLETTVQDYLEEHQNVIVAGNNITISSSSSLLPDGYAQVEYIQSNGASYLDTGLVPTDSTKITVDLFNNTTGSFYAVGARANSSSTILLAQSGSSTGATLLGSFNGTTITAKTGNTNWSRTAAGQRYLINIETNNGTGTYNVYDYNNDREFSGQTSYTSLGTISTHIYLLGFNSANVLGGTSKVYKCEIYQNDLLAFQGIPCYRVSDGVYGLYDTVSNTFKTSVTSTPFTGSTEIHDTLTISSKDEKAQWGKITGTLSNQTDLNTALGLKANSADLATVATSGSYNDLSNKPTIPTVNNAKLTIKKNASDTGTEFTANASTDVTCNLGLATVATSGSYNDLSSKPSIPTKVSDLTNDSGFISTETDPTVPSWAKASSKPSYTLDEVTDGTNRKLPTKVSDLTNDSGFITGYTETDPTVPSWAKQSSKPSYTLDEVTDGSTRKLSNYVPTSRKVNNKALSADITLNLDDVADGSTRKLSNYVPTTRTVNSKALSSNIVLTLDDVADGTNRSIPTDTSDLTNGAGFLTSFTETDPTVPSWAKQSSKPSYTLDEVTDGSTRKLSNYVPTSRKVNNKTLSSDITLNLDDVANGTTRKIPTLTSELTNDSGFLTSHQDISGKQDVLTAGEGISLANNVVKTTGIPFGICDGTSTSTAFTVTVPGIYKLEDGVCCMVKNGVVTSASGFTLNVNGLGGKPCYTNLASATRDTTLFNVAYTMLFVYDSTRVSGGCWICYRGYDANTNTIGYQLRTNSSILTVTDRSRYYKIFFTSANNNQWIPASSDWTNDATTARAVNQRPINPFGRIVYTSATTNYTTGSNLAAATIWDQYNLTLGYSFNVNGGTLTLTVNKPVYVKCAPQSDGSAIIDAETPIIQDLPTSADNKIYILLGIATSATQVELFINHPVYYHDGNGIKLWIGNTIPTKTSDLTNDSGFITSSDLPTNHVTTDTAQDISGVKTFKRGSAYTTTINGNTITLSPVNPIYQSNTGTVISPNAINVGSNYTKIENSIGRSSGNSSFLTLATYTHSDDIYNNPFSYIDITANLISFYSAQTSTNQTLMCYVSNSGTTFNNDKDVNLPNDTKTFLYVDSTKTSLPDYVSSKVPITSISVDGTTQTITNKNVDLHIPDDIYSSDFICSMTRTNVSGSGNLTLSGISGPFPVSGTPMPAGTYIVRTRMQSTTASYSLTVTFGGSYTLTTTNGVIDDTRTITLSSASTYSASITQVNANTFIKVSMFEPDVVVETVGAAAVTNDYNDLNNIPTIGNGTLTIQKNGSNVATFTANNVANVTANITVPTTVASLSDASNYVTTNTEQSISALKKFNNGIDLMNEQLLCFFTTNVTNRTNVCWVRVTERDTYINQNSTYVQDMTIRLPYEDELYSDNGSKLNIKHGNTTTYKLSSSNLLLNNNQNISWNDGHYIASETDSYNDTNLVIRADKFVNIAGYGADDIGIYVGGGESIIPSLSIGEKGNKITTISGDNSVYTTYLEYSSLETNNVYCEIKSSRCLEVISGNIQPNLNTLSTLRSDEQSYHHYPRYYFRDSIEYEDTNSNVIYKNEISQVEISPIRIASTNFAICKTANSTSGNNSSTWLDYSLYYTVYQESNKLNIKKVEESNGATSVEAPIISLNGSSLKLFEDLIGDHKVEVYTSATGYTDTNILISGTNTDGSRGLIRPMTAFGVDIGTSIYKFNKIYANTFEGNATTATTATEADYLKHYITSSTYCTISYDADSDRWITTKGIEPNSSASYYLGTSSKCWLRVCSNIYQFGSSSDCFLQSAVSNSINYINAKGHIAPYASTSYDLGFSDKKWRYIYCTYLGSSDSKVTTVYATNVGTSSYPTDSIYAKSLVIPYGYCQTAADTANKEVTLSPAVTTLTSGMIILVGFRYGNTVASPKLTIDGGTTYKNIYRNANVSAGSDDSLSWCDYEYVFLRYNGSQWVIISHNPTALASVGTSITNILPSSTNTYNLGSSSYKWNYLYARYVGSSSYPITSIYGRLNSLYGTAVGSLFFFKLVIKNNSSNAITVPRGVSLTNTTYFGSTLLEITSYEERVDDTSTSYGTTTFTGTFYTMLRFTVPGNATASTAFVPCLRYS